MYSYARIIKGSVSRLHRAGLVFLNRFSRENFHQCNICNSSTIRFFRYGSRYAGCPDCGALDRERWIHYCLSNGILKMDEQDTVLHVAPSERSLARLFQKSAEYVATDFHPERYKSLGATFMNVEDIGVSDYYTRIYLSHVLEHVNDDRMALASIHSALTKSGELWLLVPLKIGRSIDNKNRELCKSRYEAAFGQWDHVRFYGQDIVGLLVDSGFEVDILDPANLPIETGLMHGFNYGDIVFRCRKV